MNKKRVLIEITNGRIFFVFCDSEDVEVIIWNNDYAVMWKPCVRDDIERIEVADETCRLTNLTEDDVRKAEARCHNNQH